LYHPAAIATTTVIATATATAIAIVTFECAHAILDKWNSLA
jgi:hypothetical protein